MLVLHEVQGKLLKFIMLSLLTFQDVPPCAAITIYCKIGPFNKFEGKSFLRASLEWLFIKGFVISVHVPVMSQLPFRKKKSNTVLGIFVTRFAVAFGSSNTVSTMLHKCFNTDTSHKLICPNAVRLSF